MPIIAVGAAALAIGTAATTVAAVGFTVVSALEVVAAVGATVAAVGAVTGNKTLTLVGAGLGLVGGIGAVAASAGLFGDAAATGGLFGATPAASTADTASATSSDTISTLASGEAGTGATASADATANLALPAGDVATNAAAPTTTGFGGAANETIPPAIPAPTTPSPTDVTTDILKGGQGIPATTAQPLPTPSADALTQAPPSSLTPAAGQLLTPPVPPNNLGAVDPLTGNTITDAVDPLTGKIVSLPEQKSTGLFSGLLDFANKNPAITFGVAQAGGSLLSGLTSTLTPAQVDALNAQAAQNQATANLTQFQQTNLAGPKPVATLSPVTGKPAPLLTPTPGLINAAATVPPVNVTGAPV